MNTCRHRSFVSVLSYLLCVFSLLFFRTCQGDSYSIFLSGKLIFIKVENIRFYRIINVSASK